MANKLIRSNRNPIKPDKQAEISDFSNSNKGIKTHKIKLLRLLLTQT
ncbi:hypothetical protein [Levilactobacillus brevis]|nr:hypothetical protein [Levilactobacillus brevis]ARW49532.1 hypothetical protein S101106_00004 [Levilactobacillus brevis]